LLRLLREQGIPVAAVHRRSAVRVEPSGAERKVLVDATPPAYEGPEAAAWVRRLETALLAGTPVVTCNKAPLALDWARLRDAARSGNVPLACTGTVGGGTPILPALRGLDALRPVQQVEATLSGTLAAVLPQVKAGQSLAAAVSQAQRVGICEPDPRVDLEGLDAWAKACILHNALWPTEPPVGFADLREPLRLDDDSIRSHAHPAVVATLRPGRVALALRDWPVHGPGIHVRATVAGGSIALSGRGAGPLETAQVLASDVADVIAGRLAPGIAA
jgi:homoserine dehydrogenase